MDGPGNDRRNDVSELTTDRLSVYLRCLQRLEEEGVKTVSSHALARRFHLNSAQIRKDLANFGELGIRGVGYDVARLKKHLVETLGLDRTRSVVIIGAGHLGMALAGYRGFQEPGFRVLALFDSDPAVVGQHSRTGIPVLAAAELPRVLAAEHVDIGVIAVPAQAAQLAYDTLADGGVRAILNFAPTQLRQRDDVRLRNVDLRIRLEALSFFLKGCE
ncbi:MAG TPA: redox-sensing transcriptional repressor Rex [Thermoanaerobaculia bacterium]